MYGIMVLQKSKAGESIASIIVAHKSRNVFAAFKKQNLIVVISCVVTIWHVAFMPFLCLPAQCLFLHSILLSFLALLMLGGESGRHRADGCDGQQQVD